MAQMKLIRTEDEQEVMLPCVSTHFFTQVDEDGIARWRPECQLDGRACNADEKEDLLPAKKIGL